MPFEEWSERELEAIGNKAEVQFLPEEKSSLSLISLKEQTKKLLYQ
ncbi:MAG: hypothetical protein ABEJ98_03605 [Candidatus Nanohaloarchaea archaeon]